MIPLLTTSGKVWKMAFRANGGTAGSWNYTLNVCQPLHNVLDPIGTNCGNIWEKVKLRSVPLLQCVPANVLRTQTGSVATLAQ